MKKVFIITITALSMLYMSSCTKTSTTTDEDTFEDFKTEGVLNDGELWTIENEDLPTAKMRQDLDRMELIVTEDDRYSWKWIEKGGDVLHFEGEIFHEKSQFEYESGSGIWNISIIVQTINGEYYPGGWYGVYAYENENHLVLNVEPDVSSWEKHPTAEEGIGSGTNAMESVFQFSR
ncbi:hypothetical protein GYB22_07455 [bacterium]|nr:hypothetical protein [bacterium]